MNAADWMAQAQARGLLPADAQWPQGSHRPWPVLLLTALGAWLSALPLLGVVGLIFGSFVREGPGLYPVGLAALALAVMLLRGRGVPLFVEQLALPILLVGLGCLGWRLMKDLPDRAALAVLGGVCLGLAAALGRAWLRALLGAAAAALLLAAAAPSWAALRGQAGLPALLLLAGVALLWWPKWPARWAVWGDAVGTGALCTVLAGVAMDAGSSWLVAGLSGPFAAHAGWRSSLGGCLAVLATLGAAAALAWRWPALRGVRWAAVALLAALLTVPLPGLGPLAVAAALCAAQQRWRSALATALAALWVLGSFYYRMDWGLQDKAMGLLALGAVMAALARWPQRGTAALPPVAVGRPWGLAVALAGGLLVVNVGIFQKERLLASGEPLFVELAPADPRSLMQGDFMRLDYALVRRANPPERLLDARRPQLVVRRDARGVAEWVRLHNPTQPLAADERLLELTPKDGRWTLVSDAWFFKEGEAARWQPARYAEFRVMPDGRALLVGLRGAALQPL